MASLLRDVHCQLLMMIRMMIEMMMLKEMMLTSKWVRLCPSGAVPCTLHTPLLPITPLLLLLFEPKYSKLIFGSVLDIRCASKQRKHLKLGFWSSQLHHLCIGAHYRNESFCALEYSRHKICPFFLASVLVCLASDAIQNLDHVTHKLRNILTRQLYFQLAEHG